MDIGDSRKIIIIGSAGGGKSTLARKIREITGIPVIHLDCEFWQPGWVETSREQWIEKQKGFMSGERWILDGNYGGTMELRFEAADTVIFLDINKWICLYNVFRRWICNIGRNRTDMAKGCPEKIDLEFIRWIYRFPKTSRKKIMSLIESYRDKNVIIFKSRREMHKFINKLEVNTK